MIKKYLFWIWISLLWLIGFSVNAAWNTFPIWLESFPSVIDSNYTNTFLKGGAFLTNYLWQWRGLLALRNNVLVWWAKNWFPYFYLQSNQFWGLKQWFPDRFYSCDEITWTYYSMPWNCTLWETWDYTWENTYVINIFKTFFKSVVSDDYVYYEYVDNNYENYIDICWSSHSIWKSLCFKVWYDNRNTRTIVNSQNLSNITFAKVQDSWLWYAPWQWNYDIWTDTSYWEWESTVIPSNIDDYISYYEDNFWFNETMCYVWTDDLDSVYWTNWIEFEYWTGATIYWLYHYLYDTFWSNKIHNVWSFVNVWLLDYASWFKTVSDERLYMAQYNWPDQNVTYIYSWFTFPFENKPVAIYFMADLLSEEYITESSQGENIVFYCDMKLNYYNYKNWHINFNETENLVDDKIKERANDYINRNIKWSDWYSVPDLWSWSIWDWLVQSWYNIPEDLNPTSLFKDFYTKIDWLFKNFRWYSPNWIIPNWILFPMLFLILFRMLRH